MQDPIADFLTRVRNAGAARHVTCDVGASRLKEQLAKLLVEAGYIESFSVSGDGASRSVSLRLKYGADGQPVIRGIDRVSRPGRRVYRGADALPKVLGGLGTSIVSTSRGIMTDVQARSLNVGGEILCNVW
jgi:small subunit ribosomal protein S8